MGPEHDHELCGIPTQDDPSVEGKERLRMVRSDIHRLSDVPTYQLGCQSAAA